MTTQGTEEQPQPTDGEGENGEKIEQANMLERETQARQHADKHRANRADSQGPTDQIPCVVEDHADAEPKRNQQHAAGY